MGDITQRKLETDFVHIAFLLLLFISSLFPDPQCSYRSNKLRL